MMDTTKHSSINFHSRRHEQIFGYQVEFHVQMYSINFACILSVVVCRYYTDFLFCYMLHCHRHSATSLHHHCSICTKRKETNFCPRKLLQLKKLLKLFSSKSFMDNLYPQFFIHSKRKVFNTPFLCSTINRRLPLFEFGGSSSKIT